MSASKTKVSFVEPMLLLRTEKLPGDLSRWQYELKWDGFRAIAVKTLGKVHLRSRKNKDFNEKYPTIVKALAGMPDETVIDGEVVALDESGHPSFNALQNYESSKTSLLYYVFDVMVWPARTSWANR
jgi:bifunctional non-homologous end joining protein LigD